MESSVSKWLDQIGLGVYADILIENDVDMRALQINESFIRQAQCYQELTNSSRFCSTTGIL